MNNLRSLLCIAMTAPLLLGGCASDAGVPADPGAAPDHPANASAPTAPLPVGSDTLAHATTRPAPARESSDRPAHDHGHGGADGHP